MAGLGARRWRGVVAWRGSAYSDHQSFWISRAVAGRGGQEAGVTSRNSRVVQIAPIFVRIHGRNGALAANGHYGIGSGEKRCNLRSAT